MGIGHGKGGFGRSVSVVLTDIELYILYGKSIVSKIWEVLHPYRDATPFSAAAMNYVNTVPRFTNQSILTSEVGASTFFKFKGTVSRDFNVCFWENVLVFSKFRFISNFSIFASRRSYR
jgi:hypothetical protein